MKSLFSLLLLMMLAPAYLAEQDTAAFLGVTAPADYTCVDLDAKVMLALDALEALLDQLPQMTQADMYAAQMRQVSQTHPPAVIARR